MKKEKILYISSASFDEPTAQLLHVLKMSSALSNYYSVDLFAFHRGSSLDLSKFSLNIEPNIISGMRKNFSISAQLIIVLLKNIFKTTYKAVITRNVVVAFACSVFRVRYIYETHDAYRGWLKILFEKHVLKSRFLLKFVVISQSLSDDYRKMYKCEPLVCHDAADKYDLHIPIREKVKKVFYIGSLYAGRGLEIIHGLAELNADLEFHIYGGNGNNTKNIFYHGYISQQDIIKKVFYADILLMPYQENLETANKGINTIKWMSPMKMFEYMSFGIPIISSDIEVLREVLNESNSLMVPPSNIKKWNQALQLLINDKSLRIELSKNSKVNQQTQHTWDRRARIFNEFI